MADSTSKETKPPDPTVLAAITPAAPPVAGDEILPVEIEEEQGDRDIEDDDEKDVRKEELRLTKSYATDASAATGATGLTTTTTTAGVQAKKPWYKNLNPLRWRPPPPVPKERTPSREHKAGFWSQVTFQWMAPLMNVSVDYVACIFFPAFMYMSSDFDFDFDFDFFFFFFFFFFFERERV
jgi:ATP-binding cassette, subfamily C (CFTR/MRP), member 1